MYRSNLFTSPRQRSKPMATDTSANTRVDDETKRDVAGLVVGAVVVVSIIAGLAMTSKKSHAAYVAPVSVCSLVDARGEE